MVVGSGWNALYTAGAPFINMVYKLIPAWVKITSIIKCRMKLHINSQTSTVHPLKFGKG